MGVMVYALVIYQMRARAIRQRTGAPYDDRLGPVSIWFASRYIHYVSHAHHRLQTILCVCLLGETCS